MLPLGGLILMNSLLRISGRESRIDQIDVGGRSVRLAALPIGIAPDEFASCVLMLCRTEIGAQ